MTMILSGTNGGTFPTWTTAGRPASPAVGQMGYNTTIGQFDCYTSGGWVTVLNSGSPQSQLPSNIAGNGPAFSAYATGTQSITSGVTTLQTLAGEHFDTASAFNNTGSVVGSAPAYSFNPQVAGYYQINFGFGLQTYTNTGSGEQIAILYKNGGIWCYGSNQLLGSPTHYILSVGSALVYLNGSSDYIQCYCYQETGGTRTTVGNGNWNYLSGSMVRGA